MFSWASISGLGKYFWFVGRTVCFLQYFKFSVVYVNFVMLLLLLIWNIFTAIEYFQFFRSVLFF